MRGRRWAEPTQLYLEAQTRVQVRFHEVDALRIVWHGHYVTYFEDARTAFGREHGLRYEDFLEAGYIVPLVHLDIDFNAPASYDDELLVTARLHLEDAARVTFTYRITDAGGKKLATGRTVQAFMDLDGRLVLTPPAFYQSFVNGWRSRLEAP